jgi:hypothetical protein
MTSLREADLETMHSATNALAIGGKSPLIMAGLDPAIRGPGRASN